MSQLDLGAGWRREFAASRDSRRAALGLWETRRQSRVLVLGAARGADLEGAELIRAVVEQFRRMPSRPVDHLDLMVLGRGLSPDVAVRLTAVVREYAREITLVIAGHAGPGETVLALGADSVWMQPTAALGTVLPPEPDTRVDGFRALLIAAAAFDEGVWRSALGGAEASSLGKAQRQVDRTRRIVETQCAARLHPPAEDDVRAAFTELTRWAGSPRDAVARWQARALRALSVMVPTHAEEQFASEVMFHGKRAVGLIAGMPPGPLALLESVALTQTLESDGDKVLGGAAWLTWPDNEIQ